MVLLSLLYLTSAAVYITKREWVRQALADLGYPSYLVPVLIVVKLLAVAAILSRVSVTLSDLAYAGMFYHLLLAASAHIRVRKPGGPRGDEDEARGLQGEWPRDGLT